MTQGAKLSLVDNCIFLLVIDIWRQTEELLCKIERHRILNKKHRLRMHEQYPISKIDLDGHPDEHIIGQISLYYFKDKTQDFEA